MFFVLVVKEIRCPFAGRANPQVGSAATGMPYRFTCGKHKLAMRSVFARKKSGRF
jgi:hypothetical protein